LQNTCSGQDSACNNQVHAPPEQGKEDFETKQDLKLCRVYVECEIPTCECLRNRHIIQFRTTQDRREHAHILSAMITKTAYAKLWILFTRIHTDTSRASLKDLHCRTGYTVLSEYRLRIPALQIAF
jgi:hypothetical protein